MKVPSCLRHGVLTGRFWKVLGFPQLPRQSGELQKEPAETFLIHAAVGAFKHPTMYLAVSSDI